MLLRIGVKIWTVIFVVLVRNVASRIAPDGAEVISACFFAYTLKLELPGTSHHGIRAADFQRKAWDFYSGLPVGPPINEAYWILALPSDFQEDIVKECPPLLALSYLIVAETKIFLEPAEAKEMVQIGAGVLARVESRTQSMIMESWPIHQALQRFRNTHIYVAHFQQTELAGGFVDIVLAHCREDLTWLQTALTHWAMSDRIRLFIYEKCRETGNVSDVVPTVNIQVIDGPPGGRKDECSAYLSHLVYASRSNNIGVYTFFLQADALHHTKPHLLNILFRAIGHRTLDIPYLPLSQVRMVSSTSPCKRAIFKQIIGRDPEMMPRSYCCAQFLVRADVIRTRSVDFWEAALKAMDETLPEGCESIKRPGMHCFVFEAIWHVMFREPEHITPRPEDARLPMFLRLEEADGSDLPGGVNATMFWENSIIDDAEWVNDLQNEVQQDLSGAPSIGYKRSS